QGKYDQAESLIERSVVIREEVLGPNHSEFATTLHNRALVWEAQGKYEEAEVLYSRVFDIYDKSLGEKHLWVAAALNNRADLLRR
ncbi:unnamed protein product, partial [Ectocarpus sp. 12 AP-2014]